MKKIILIIIPLFALVAIIAWNKSSTNKSVQDSLVGCSGTPNTAVQSRDATIEGFRQAMVDLGYLFLMNY